MGNADVRATARRPASPRVADAPAQPLSALFARLSIHIPDAAVRQCLLPADGTQVILGRDPGCAIVINHHSVSRRHLRLWNEHDLWQIEDLDSKNGTRVDGHRLHAAQAIDGGRWFSVGDVYCQFELLDAVIEQRQRATQERRQHSSTAWNSRLRHGSEGQRLIADLLHGIVDIAEARRGFVLSTDHRGHWHVRACFGIEPDELGARSFSGSRSAVDRAIAEQRPVYLSDQRDQAWLRDKASVMQGGIRALVALPLLRQGRTLGVVYADTDEQERVYTELDAQLLGALVEHAGSVLEALELEAGLAQVSAMLKVGPGGFVSAALPAPDWPTAPPSRRTNRR